MFAVDNFTNNYNPAGGGISISPWSRTSLRQRRPEFPSGSTSVAGTLTFRGRCGSSDVCSNQHAQLPGYLKATLWKDRTRPGAKTNYRQLLVEAGRRHLRFSPKCGLAEFLQWPGPLCPRKRLTVAGTATHAFRSSQENDSAY